MTSGKAIAYLRVSTQRQGRSGLGLEAQREAVRSYVAAEQWTLLAEVVEIESGKRSDRPQLAQALALCRIHGATLVIAKLDRLARNVAFLANLMDSGLEFVACDMPSANRLTLHILAAVAEGEAAAISKRTKDALAAAKARGTVLGGNRGNLTHELRCKAWRVSAQTRTQRAAKRAADLRPVIQDIQSQGATSLRQIANMLNVRNIPTVRGGRWYAAQVADVMRHA